MASKQPTLFFRQPIPGVAAQRYCIGRFTDRARTVFQVTTVQVSCPDGTEIERPRIVNMPSAFERTRRVDW